MTSQDQQQISAFRELLAAYGNTAELARRAGVSRSSLEKKKAGQRPVRSWDVWAVREALRQQEEA